MNKKTARSIVMMGLSSVTGYFVTLFLTAYITENIGIEAYGFVSIAKTVVNYGGIITIALTSLAVRYIAVSFHKGDIKEVNSYYVSSINASIMLCLFLALIFTGVVLKLECFIKIPANLLYSVKLLFALVFVSFVVTTISTTYGSGFYIKNRLDLLGLLKTLSYIIELIILVILFTVFKPSLFFVGIGLFGAALTILIGSGFFNRKLVPEFKYNKKLHSNQKIKILLGNGLWNSINQLGNVLNSGLDLLVSNAMLNDIQTGQVAVAKSIGAIFSVLASVIFQPLQPELLRTYSEGINEGFLKQLKKSMKLCGFFGSLAFSGFLTLGLLFYKLWLPSQNSELLQILTVLTVFVFIMDIFLQPIYYVNVLTVKNRMPCFVTIAGGILNVVGMFFLIKYTDLGVYAVPLTTAAIMFLINILFNPIYACHCLKIRRTYFYPLILRHLLSTAVMSILFEGVVLLVKPMGWIGLIGCAAIMTVMGVLVYVFITFNKQELGELKMLVRRKNNSVN